MKAASRTAFATGLTALLTGKTPNPKVAIVAAVAAYGTYFFVNADEEDIYVKIDYYYREVGPGRFDSAGTFIGDYEIKKTTRVTKNSNYTGGTLNTQVESSTILEPWF